MTLSISVTLAKAVVQGNQEEGYWIPACAGMTANAITSAYCINKTITPVTPAKAGVQGFTITGNATVKPKGHYTLE